MGRQAGEHDESLRPRGALLAVALLAAMAGAGCGQDAASARTDGGTGGGAGGGGAAGSAAGTGGGAGAGGAAAGAGNQIVNGDFSDGMTDWGVISSSMWTTASVANGQLCVSFIAGIPITVVWPGGTSPVASLLPGVTYVLAYQVSSNVPLSPFEVQLGPVLTLYDEPTTDFDVTTDVPGATPQTFSHTFSVTAADAQAGLVFKFYYGIYSGMANVCFDDVSLTTSD